MLWHALLELSRGGAQPTFAKLLTALDEIFHILQTSDPSEEDLMFFVTSNDGDPKKLDEMDVATTLLNMHLDPIQRLTVACSVQERACKTIPKLTEQGSALPTVDWSQPNSVRSLTPTRLGKIRHDENKFQSHRPPRARSHGYNTRPGALRPRRKQAKSLLGCTSDILVRLDGKVATFADSTPRNTPAVGNFQYSFHVLRPRR